MPLELATPRTLTFTDRGRLFSYTIKPVTKQQWLLYFRGIVSTQELDGDGNQTSTYDSSAPRMELLQAVLTGGSGFSFDLSTVDGWQSKLPLSHRRALADMLVATDIDTTASADELNLGYETVRLRSTWTAGDDNTMVESTGLIHVFYSPTADHQRRYSRAYNTSVVEGGNRNGRTRFLGAQAVLIEIYDELIDSVSGYTLNGDALKAGDIAGAMDAYHKVAACTALFTPVQVG